MGTNLYFQNSANWIPIFLNVKLFSIKIGQVLEFSGLATVMDTFILNMTRKPMLGTDTFMSDMLGW